jgi:hypothetical protein
VLTFRIESFVMYRASYIVYRLSCHISDRMCLYIAIGRGSSLLPIIVPQRSQREIFTRRPARFRILPVQHHLADEDGVAHGGEEVAPPDETVAGLLAGGEYSDGTAEERVEYGECGEIASGAETVIGGDLRGLGEYSERDGTGLQSRN